MIFSKSVINFAGVSFPDNDNLPLILELHLHDQHIHLDAVYSEIEETSIRKVQMNCLKD